MLDREEEIIEMIRKLGNGKFIVVGGYAVDAYGLHRFSVDLDIVLKENNLKGMEGNLRNNNYKLELKKENFDTVYGGKFIRFVKLIQDNKVSVDLLVNALVSRTTEASFSYGYIKKHSHKKIISGITDSVEALIPEKELLISTKIHSGRITDARDIVVLNKRVDKNKIIKHTKRGNLEKLKETIDDMIKFLEEDNFVDSLKGVFRIKRNVEKDINSAKRLLGFVKNSV